MLKLPNVTLCTLGSEKYKAENQAALDYSSSKVEFGAVKNIIQECPTIDEWNRAIVFDLGDYIQTDYAMLIHPDGGVGNPDAWDDKWLDYDYIGSPWPLPTDDVSYRDKHGAIQRVGNSVSIRSRKLMRLPKQINMAWQAFHGFTNEDGAICVNYRHLFEQAGCRFAPFEEAVKFGCETLLEEHVGRPDPFAYHRHNNFINEKYPNFEQS